MHKFLNHYGLSAGIIGVMCIITVTLHGCKMANSPGPISAVELSGQDIRTSSVMKPDHWDPLSVKDVSHTVIAYYFHWAVRCPGCLQIEFMADQAIREVFEQELKDGNLVWLVLNMEESDNQGFVDQYDLETSTLVLVDSSSAGNGRWKKLEKVWNLKDDPEGFRRYIEQEVTGYLTKK